MSMTNASTTFGAVRRPEVAHPRDEVARGRLPYHAITVTRSYEGVARRIADSIRNRQIHEVAIATAREMLQGVVSLVSDQAGSVTSAVVHHHAIVEAISTRQPDAAGRAMADHIVYTENAVTQYIPSSITDAMVSHSSNEGVA
jgi:FCD domain